MISESIPSAIYPLTLVYKPYIFKTRIPLIIKQVLTQLLLYFNTYMNYNTNTNRVLSVPILEKERSAGQRTCQAQRLLQEYQRPWRPGHAAANGGGGDRDARVKGQREHKLSDQRPCEWPGQWLQAASQQQRAQGCKRRALNERIRHQAPGRRLPGAETAEDAEIISGQGGAPPAQSLGPGDG